MTQDSELFSGSLDTVKNNGVSKAQYITARVDKIALDPVVNVKCLSNILKNSVYKA
jgi:hypothetical protein